MTLQLGDNLFRRGQFREANRHFELALNPAPGEVDIRLRLDRCRPLLPPPPPPPVVIVQPIFVPPPVIIRPRVAVLNFFVNADPRIAPPGFGDWAADQFAGQFHPWYDVIDRGELFWYMGRLGLTVRDVMLNPAARFYLARALNVRYFVFGYIQQTASFDVTAQLVDAETGIRQGVAMIHVHDRQEMKWRHGRAGPPAPPGSAPARRVRPRGPGVRARAGGHAPAGGGRPARRGPGHRPPGAATAAARHRPAHADRAGGTARGRDGAGGKPPP